MANDTQKSNYVIHGVWNVLLDGFLYFGAVCNQPHYDYLSNMTQLTWNESQHTNENKVNEEYFNSWKPSGLSKFFVDF